MENLYLKGAIGCIKLKKQWAKQRIPIVHGVRPPSTVPAVFLPKGCKCQVSMIIREREREQPRQQTTEQKAPSSSIMADGFVRFNQFSRQARCRRLAAKCIAMTGSSHGLIRVLKIRFRFLDAKIRRLQSGCPPLH